MKRSGGLRGLGLRGRRNILEDRGEVDGLVFWVGSGHRLSKRNVSMIGVGRVDVGAFLMGREV